MDIIFLKIEVKEEILNGQDFNTQETEEIRGIFNQYTVDFSDFSFDDNTVSDFQDYLEFLEPQQVYFITNMKSDRLLKIVRYLEENLDTEFILFDVAENDYYYNKKEENFNFSITFKDTINVEERLSNSHFSMNTGYYNHQQNLHIKHLYIDSFSDINKIDKSIFINSGLNSLIITKNELGNLKESKSYITSIIIKEEMLLQRINSEDFMDLSIEDLKESMEKFIKTGKNDINKGIIKDFFKYFFPQKIFSLFIYNNKIYFDINGRLELDTLPSKNIFQILNTLKLIKVDNIFEEDFLREFFMTNLISYKLKENIKFVTRYNKRILSNVFINGENQEYIKWIGYKTSIDYYLFNKLNQKTYKVNKNFMDIFEFLIKDSEDSIKEFDKEIVDQAKELLKSG